MKTLLSFFSTLIIIAETLFSQQTYLDDVSLKNCSSIQSFRFEQSPKVSFNIHTKNNGVFVFNKEDVKIATTELVQSNIFSENQLDYYSSKKDPATAILLSALLPGAGQYYNNEVSKGVIMTSLYVAGWALYFAAGYSEEWYEDDYYWASYGYYYEEETPWLYVGLGMVVGTWVWSIVDAGISASNHNKLLRNRNRSYGHMYENHLNEKLIFGIDVGGNLNGFAGSVTLHF